MDSTILLFVLGSLATVCFGSWKIETINLCSDPTGVIAHSGIGYKTWHFSSGRCYINGTLNFTYTYISDDFWRIGSGSLQTKPTLQITGIPVPLWTRTDTPVPISVPITDKDRVAMLYDGYETGAAPAINISYNFENFDGAPTATEYHTTTSAHNPTSITPDCEISLGLMAAVIVTGCILIILVVIVAVLLMRRNLSKTSSVSKSHQANLPASINTPEQYEIVNGNGQASSDSRRAPTERATAQSDAGYDNSNEYSRRQNPHVQESQSAYEYVDCAPHNGPYLDPNTLRATRNVLAPSVAPLHQAPGYQGVKYIPDEDTAYMEYDA